VASKAELLFLKIGIASSILETGMKSHCGLISLQPFM